MLYASRRKTILILLLILCQGQASPSAIHEAKERFNCKDPSLWNDPMGTGVSDDFDHTRCNTLWGLKNTNDANVLMERYILTLERKIMGAKKNNDTSVLLQFKRQGFCNQNDSMDECHDSIRRRAMSHTLRVRNNILESNRIMTEISEGEPLQTQSMSPPQKSLIETIDEERKAKSPTKSRSCEENPFIPCIVHYGKAGSAAASDTARTDSAHEELARGSFNVHAVKHAFIREGKNTTLLEVSEPGKEEKGLRKLLENRLSSNSQNNIYHQSHYAKDLTDERKRLTTKEQEEKLLRAYQRTTNDINWITFNEVMDELATRRAQAQSAGELINFYFPIQTAPRGHGTKLQTIDSQLIHRLTN